MWQNFAISATFFPIWQKKLKFINCLAKFWVTLGHFFLLWANLVFSNLAKFCENLGKIWTKPSGHTSPQLLHWRRRQIDSCPLHNLKRGTCEEGDICDGDCKYVVKFVNIINESNKG